MPWRKTHLVAIRVYPGPGRPYYLKAQGAFDGVFLRVGSSNRRADRVMVDDLRRFSLGKTFDEQPMEALNSEAIDFRAASEFFRPVRRLTKRDFTVLGLLVECHGVPRPTVGGVLLFGKERQRSFPDAYLQAGCFRGVDRTRILDTLEIRGHLPSVAEEALAFVRKHESKGIEIRRARHEERWSVPLIAVREAIINAVVHADYGQRGAPIRVSLFDDRIEVENPGLLPFGLTVADILQGVSKLRNRVIGRVFKELGLIEQWGSGIGRMAAACREACLPEPQFEEIAWHFRVTLSKKPSVSLSGDEVEQGILSLLGKGGGITTAEIARAIHRSARATRTRLAGLISRGLVTEVGSGPRDPKRRYYLAE